MATLEPVRVVYCTVCGLPPEFCEYNTEVPHPASSAQDAPAGASGGGSAAKAQQALAGLSLADAGEGPAGGASAVRRVTAAQLLELRCADVSRARLPRVAQKAGTQTRPRRALRAARSQPRSRFVRRARVRCLPVGAAPISQP